MSHKKSTQQHYTDEEKMRLAEFDVLMEKTDTEIKENSAKLAQKIIAEIGKKRPSPPKPETKTES